MTELTVFDGLAIVDTVVLAVVVIWIYYHSKNHAK